MLPITHTIFAADSSSGIGALGIDGKAFVIQLITFLLAFWVLKRYAFGPIIKIMNERRQTIEAGVSLGEKMRADESKAAATVEKELREARTKADAIIAEAEKIAREVGRQREVKAGEKAESIIAAAKDQAGQEIARARKQLEKELVGLIADATEVIIDEKVDAKKDAALITKALERQRV